MAHHHLLIYEWPHWPCIQFRKLLIPMKTRALILLLVLALINWNILQRVCFLNILSICKLYHANHAQLLTNWAFPFLLYLPVKSQQVLIIDVLVITVKLITDHRLGVIIHRLVISLTPTPTLNHWYMSHISIKLITDHRIQVHEVNTLKHWLLIHESYLNSVFRTLQSFRFKWINLSWMSI